MMRQDGKGLELIWLRGFPEQGSSEMCDYSLQNVKSRPARVGDKLTTSDFGTGTRGFAASEDASVAVCVLPGTELSFAEEVAVYRPVCSVGARKRSITRRRSSGKSTRKRPSLITTRWNFRTARSCS